MSQFGISTGSQSTVSERRVGIGVNTAAAAEAFSDDGRFTRGLFYPRPYLNFTPGPPRICSAASFGRSPHRFERGDPV